MKYATKHFLVTSDELQRQHQRLVRSKPYYIPHPKAKRTKEAETRIQNIFDDRRISNQDKILNFSSE